VRAPNGREHESKDPDNVSPAMPRQGVLSKSHVATIFREDETSIRARASAVRLRRIEDFSPHRRPARSEAERRKINYFPPTARPLDSNNGVVN